MKETYMSNFNDRLRIAMMAMDINQKSLAEKTGLTPSQISNFCAGRNIPDRDNVIKLTLALYSTSDFLLGIDEIKQRLYLTKSSGK